MKEESMFNQRKYVPWVRPVGKQNSKSRKEIRSFQAISSYKNVEFAILSYFSYIKVPYKFKTIKVWDIMVGRCHMNMI